MKFSALFLLVAALARAATEPPTELEQQLKKIIDVYTTVEREAADPVSSERSFFSGAIPGMLKRLDPHSIFFDPGQYEQVKQMEKSERKGFGSVVSVLPGRVIVLQAMPGTPSAKSGIAPGDEILAINNIALASLEFDQLVELLTQARQQRAIVHVRRQGNARLLSFVLTPELVDTPSVDRAFLLEPGIGYVRVASFDPPTGKLVQQAIEKIGGAALKGLVLDLRNNPGGVVGAALETAALFLKPGQRIFSVHGRANQGEEVGVPKEAQPYTFPVSVLVNEKSASASEIVCGALQDHDRATIAGERTYGKGLVQSVYPLSGSTGLALTTAFYYTPSGRSIQKPLHGGQLGGATLLSEKREFRTDSGRVVEGGGGIQPDIEIAPASLSQLEAVLDTSGYFTSFATDFTSKSGPIHEPFELSPATMDEFQVYLAQRNIRPALSEWIGERSWIQSRLTQEIFNLAFGVEKGDEVEARRDVQVRRAVDALAQPLAHGRGSETRAEPQP